MKKIICFIALALAAAGCIYPFQAEFAGETPERLVVSGDILIGEQTRINLGYVFPIGTYKSTMRKNVPDATVTVENDRGQVFKGVRKAGGLHIIDTSNAPEDARYRLYIKFKDGKEYATPWSGVYQAPEITDLSYTTDGSNIHLFISLDGADSLWNFRWDYTETWEYHAWFVPELMFVPGLPSPDNQNPAKIFRDPNPEEDYYYCWNSRENVEPCLASAEGKSDNIVSDDNFLTIPCSDERLMVLYSIEVTARGMSSAGRAYLNHQSVISNISGDLFQPVPSEMPGNVTSLDNPDEMTIGYVETCRRTSRRLFVSGVYHIPFDPYLLLFHPEPDEDGNFDLDNLFVNHSPVFGPRSLNGALWGSKRCTDCRAWGGTKTKPEWWPNDHK